ncbi:hypothetical protein MNBD_PLANCTO03-2213 [hydrothermal vent metagenome]|uniref:Uncharacterized protein n=1 Tax=hydrothermal vent metagenome TaxID=652676 RepID=A0A3B1DYR4_9ZZZZ
MDSNEMLGNIATQPHARPARALRARAGCAALGGPVFRIGRALPVERVSVGWASRSPQLCCAVRILALLLCLVPATPAILAQSAPPTPPADDKAAFILTAGNTTPDTTLDPEASPPAWRLLLDSSQPTDQPTPSLDPGGADLDHRPIADWMLATWAPSTMPDSAADLAAHFALGTATDSRRPASLTDRWTRSIFSEDAGQLTSLTPGSQLFSWELTDDITLAGVGARRLFTDRDRAFVVSAEAGFDLSPRVGLQVGYELLQTSAGGTLPDDAGGDSLFARFQLRF